MNTCQKSKVQHHVILKACAKIKSSDSLDENLGYILHWPQHRINLGWPYK